MNTIAAIVSDVQKVGIRAASHGAVEIDDSIEGAAPANPGVDLIAHLRFRVVPARVPGSWRDVMAWHDGDADGLGMRSPGEMLAGLLAD
jgi:hypothetical protein